MSIFSKKKGRAQRKRDPRAPCWSFRKVRDRRLLFCGLFFGFFFCHVTGVIFVVIRGCQTSGRCDVGDDKITVDRRLGALRKRDVRDGDRIANLEASNSRRQLFWNVTRGNNQFDLWANNRQQAAFADARAFVFAFKLDVNEEVDLGCALKAHQVEVGRKVLDHIALNVPTDDANVVVTVYFEVEKRRQETTCTQLFKQHVEGDIDRYGVNAAAVYDAWYVPVPAGLTSGPLACPRPYRGVKIWNLTSHGYSPMLGRASSKGVCPREGAAIGKNGRLEKGKSLAASSGPWQSQGMSIIRSLSLSRKPATAFVIVGLYWGVFAAYAPEIKARVGAGDALYGSLLLGTSVGLVSSMWLAPRLDRLLGDRGLQFSALALAVAFLLPGLAEAPWPFLLAMIAVGMASGLTDVLMNARVSDLEAANARSLMNANHAMFSVGYAVAAIATGLAREAHLPPFAIFALVGLVVVALAPGLRISGSAVSRAADTAARFPWRVVLPCGLIVLIAFMSEAAVEAWSALHVERTLSGGAAQGALGPAMLGLTMAVGRFSGQAVAERLHELKVITWATLISAIGALIAAMAPTPFVAYIGFGTLGLGISVIGPMGLALVGRVVPPWLRTQAIARAAIIGFSGFFVAPVLMGGMSEVFGLRWAFASIAVLLTGLFPLVIIFGRRGAR